MTEAFQEAEEPRVESLDEDEGEEEFELVEPTGVTRISPYAIASLVVVGIAAYASTSTMANLLFQASLAPNAVDVFRLFLPAVFPIALASVSLWLAARAEDEIFLEPRGFGGVGFYRAARILAMILITLIVLSIVAAFLFASTGIDRVNFR